MVNAKKDVIRQETDLGLTPWESSGAHITLQLSPTLGQGFGFFASPVTFSLLWSGPEAGLMVGGSLSDEDLPWVPLCRRQRAGGHSSGMQ